MWWVLIIQSHARFLVETLYSKIECVCKIFVCFRLLSDPEGLDRYLLETGFEQVFHTQPTPVLHSTATRFVFDSSVTPPPDSGMTIKQDGYGSGACLIYKYLWANGGQGVGALAS